MLRGGGAASSATPSSELVEHAPIAGSVARVFQAAFRDGAEGARAFCLFRGGGGVAGRGPRWVCLAMPRPSTRPNVEAVGPAVEASMASASCVARSRPQVSEERTA